MTSTVFRFDTDQMSPPGVGRNTSQSAASEYSVYDVVVITHLYIFSRFPYSLRHYYSVKQVIFRSGLCLSVCPCGEAVSEKFLKKSSEPILTLFSRKNAYVLGSNK